MAQNTNQTLARDVSGSVPVAANPATQTLADGQRKEERLLTSRTNHRSTEPERNRLKDAYIIREVQLPIKKQASDPALHNYVHAVVSAIADDGVILNCQTSIGERTIQLPTAVVPDQLRRYGAPVTITLHVVNGIRTPVIEARKTNIVEDNFENSFRSWMQTR